MKKLCFFLLATICCVSSMATIDLQPRNVYFEDGNGLNACIQNNGSEDFTGAFMINLNTKTGVTLIKFSGSIKSGEYTCLRLSSLKTGYSIEIDSRNEISETNERNNNLWFEFDKPQVKLLSSWGGVLADRYRDTLFILPGEYFYEQFSLSDLNYKKSIIGLDFKSNFWGFKEEQEYSFHTQGPYTEGGELYDGKYSNNSSSWNDPQAYSQWMANSSEAAINQFWLGNFSGTSKGMKIGAEANIDLYISFALTSLERRQEYANRVIKVIDRIRGDVNDDGIVNQKDLDILMDVVNNGLWNPCLSFKNMYVRRGMNYGTGTVLFNQPDFISNCLINIWLHNNNDPLVKDLGIGELMSKTSLSVEKIPNNFSVINENIDIDAPGADLYNVTAQVNNKSFQMTGKIGEKIKVPAGATNIRVETVRLQQDVSTFLTSSVKENKPDAYFANNSLNIKATGKITVLNLSGQIMISTLLNSEESQIDASNWAKGIYIVKMGSKTTKVIK